MRVYGWTAMGMGEQLRCIVGAKSFAAASRASEAAGLGKIHRGYCSTTANARELEAALLDVVLAKGLNDHDGAYVAVKNGKLS